MALTPYSPGTGTDHSEIVKVLIENSATIAVGDLVRTDTTTGYLENGGSAAAALGIVVGFSKADGTPLSPDDYVAGTATNSDVQTAVAASDNATTKAKWALVETSPWKKWSAQVSGTLGTTNNSPTSSAPRLGGFINIDSGNTNYDRVLETSFIRSRSAGTVQNFYVWGVDPRATTRLIVSLACSERLVEQK